MLEYHADGTGGENVVLVSCPVCGYVFEDNPSVTDSGVRFGSDRPRHLFEEHDVGDFLG